MRINFSEIIQAMSVLLVLFVVLFVVAILLAMAVQQSINARAEYNQLVQIASKPRSPIEFPRYVGRDAREVFEQINRDFPVYHIEIVGLDYANTLTKNYDPKRIRMYITRTSKVLRVTLG
jgi:hypothetical protein